MAALRKVVTICCVAGLLVATLLGAQAATRPLVPVAIYTGTDYNFAAAYIAEAEGLFRSNGIDGTVRVFGSGAEAVQALRSTRTGYVLAGDLPSMKTWAVGDVVGISPLTWDDSSVSILASQGIKSAGDLRGKRIATILGSSNEIFLTNYLRQNGLRRGDVEMINLSPGDMPVALAKGEIVAFMANQLTTAKGLQAVPGSHYLQRGTQGLGTNRIIVSSLRTTTTDDPKATQDVLKALLEATRYIHNEPSSSYSIVGLKLSTSPSNARKNMRVFHYSMVVDRAFVNDMTSESNLAVELNMLKTPIDWKTQFDTTFLRTIDRALVVFQP